MMETCQQASEQRFNDIEAQLTRLVIQPQAPIILSPQPHTMQHQAVPLREHGASTAGPPPPLVPSLS